MTGKSSRRACEPFVLGREAAIKLLEIEGLSLTPFVEAMLADFDCRGLSPDERQAELLRHFSKAAR